MAKLNRIFERLGFGLGRRNKGHVGSERNLADLDQRRALVQKLIGPVEAGVAAEILRYQSGRLAWPSDVYASVGELAYCMEGLPQAMEEMGAFLRRRLDAGRLRRDDGGDPAESVLAFEEAARAVQEAVKAATTALQDAQRAVSRIGGVRKDGDG